jgi:ribokinase
MINNPALIPGRLSHRMPLDLICVGEYYRDIIFYKLPRLPRLGEELKTQSFACRPGGGAVITAVTARRLGLRAGLATVAGEKQDLAALRREGLDLRHSVIDPRGRRAVTVAVSTVRDRYFLTSEGPNAEFQKLIGSKRLYPYLASARHVHFAFQPKDPDELISWMSRLRKENVTTSLDVGWSPRLLSGQMLQRLLRHTTIFFPNWAEAQAIARVSRLEPALAVLARTVKLPVVKLGARGAAAWDGTRVMRAASRKVRLVDSTGAGDAFDGGFLYGYLRGLPLAKCLDWGNRCGALAASLPGGFAPLPSPKRGTVKSREAAR